MGPASHSACVCSVWSGHEGTPRGLEQTSTSTTTTTGLSTQPAVLLTAAGERVGARHRVRRSHLRVHHDSADAAVKVHRVLTVVLGVQLRPGVAVGPVQLVRGGGLMTYIHTYSRGNGYGGGGSQQQSTY